MHYNRMFLSLLLSNFRLRALCEDIPYCQLNYKGCCEGYLWNSKNNACEECIQGYHGADCSMQCPFPTYGIRCQKYCTCSKDLCNVSTGCSGPFDDENISSTQGLSTRVEFENSTFLISKISFSTSPPLDLTTPNGIIYIFIHLLGFVSVALVFANICIYLYDHRKQRKSFALRATFQNCPENSSIIVWFNL